MKRLMYPFILALVLSLCLTVHAQEVPDLTQNGTITFEVSWQGESLSGGSVLLYRVGDIVESDGNYSFAPVAALADAGLSLEDTNDPALAARLAALVSGMDTEPLTAPVQDGYAKFRDVAPGLYLVIQNDACDGFAPMSPFLISMPRYEDGAYITDVTAHPKVPLETEPTQPTEPTDPTSPTGPTGPDIPKTGQLNWPVHLLAVMGLAFFVMGWILCFGPKRTQHET